MNFHAKHEEYIPLENMAEYSVVEKTCANDTSIQLREISKIVENISGLVIGYPIKDVGVRLLYNAYPRKQGTNITELKVFEKLCQVTTNTRRWVGGPCTGDLSLPSSKFWARRDGKTPSFAPESIARAHLFVEEDDFWRTGRGECEEANGTEDTVRGSERDTVIAGEKAVRREQAKRTRSTDIASLHAPWARRPAEPASPCSRQAATHQYIPPSVLTLRVEEGVDRGDDDRGDSQKSRGQGSAPPKLLPDCAGACGSTCIQ